MMLMRIETANRQRQAVACLSTVPRQRESTAAPAIVHVARYQPTEIVDLNVAAGGSGVAAIVACDSACYVAGAGRGATAHSTMYPVPPAYHALQRQQCWRHGHFCQFCCGQVATAQVMCVYSLTQQVAIQLVTAVAIGNVIL